MPALFAYLIAVGLLLGGGYGALSWLAAPEPVKVVAKAKPKAPSHYASNSEANSSEASSPVIKADHNTREQVASDSKDRSAIPASTEVVNTEASVAQGEPVARAQPSAPGQEPQNGAVNAQASVSPAASAEAKQAETKPEEAKQEEAKQEEPRQEVKPPALAVSHALPGSPRVSSNQQVALSAAPAKTIKRPHPREVVGRSEKRALALMTLRTIEFPNGRRVTQLIPYRSEPRIVAFDPDD